MKALIVTITMIAFITLSSYKQDDKVDKLLKNQNTREEVFNEILNNRELMIDFMNAMHGNQHAMMMWNQSYRHLQNGRKDTTNHAMMDHSFMMGGNYGNHMMNSAYINNNGDNVSMGINQMMNQMMNHPKLMHEFIINMLNTYGQDSTFVNSMAEIMANHPQLMNNAMHNYSHSSTKETKDSHFNSEMHHRENPMHN